MYVMCKAKVLLDNKCFDIAKVLWRLHSSAFGLIVLISSLTRCLAGKTCPAADRLAQDNKEISSRRFFSR